MSVQRASSLLFRSPEIMFKSKRVPSPKDLFSMPDKWKGGRIEKFFNYWKGVRMDYAEAFKDIINGSKKRPLKASIIGTVALSALYLNKHNPDERHYKEFITDIGNELTVVPHSQRSPKSEEWHTSVVRLDNAGLLRRWNLVFFSVIWKADFDSVCGLYKSQCEYLKPGYLDFMDRIVDIGCLNTWWMAEKFLIEYDVNPEEWDEKGAPTKPDNQLKHMW